MNVSILFIRICFAACCRSIFLKPTMFKKLKQKIEEGGESGIDKVAFSPRKLPGSVVRSSSQAEEPPSPQTSENAQPTPTAVQEPPSESRDEDQGITIEPVNAPSVRGSEQVSSELHVPDHMILKSSARYDAVLEARIKELEQECSNLSEKLAEAQRTFDDEKAFLKKDVERLDKEATELKLEIVELQLEKSSLQQRVDEADRVTEEKVAAIEEKRRQLEGRVTELQQTVSERDKELMDTRERYTEQEEKLENMGSTLEAYGHSSESEVIHRLQSEVAALEKTIDSRNLDIQILERRLAAQAKEKDKDIEMAIENQQTLKQSCSQLREELTSMRTENKQLLRELEQEQQNGGHKEREMAQLHHQLQLQTHNHQQLVKQVDHLKSSHAQQLKEVDGLVQEKDSRISELLMHLRKLRGEVGTNPNSADLPPSLSLKPPGSVKRTASVSVQTSMLPDYAQQGSFEGQGGGGAPAILPLGDEGLNEPGLHMNGGDSAAMKSLGPTEELELLRRDQLRLEEEVTEKAKIIRLQQQKIVDMRKELQRSQSTVDLNDLALQSGSRTAPPRPHPPNNRKERSLSPPPRIAIASDVNFQYLKHVVMKFICSREDEALQLVRAISVLLELSPQEEKHIKEYLGYKMSWFGSMPTPLYQPMGTS